MLMLFYRLLSLFLFFSLSFSCFAQEITMFDNSLSYRYYQDDQRISYKEVTKLMAKDSVTNLHWNRARTKNTHSQM